MTARFWEIFNAIFGFIYRVVTGREYGRKKDSPDA